MSENAKNPPTASGIAGRQTALGVIKDRITRLEQELTGLRALSFELEDWAMSKEAESALWYLLIKVAR